MIDDVQVERRASALAFSTRFGARAARDKFGVSERTFFNWRRRLKTDAPLREVYERKVKLLEAVALEDALDAPRAHVGRPRALLAAVEREAAACARLAGLPAVEGASASHPLPSRHVVDLVLLHSDGRYTFCAVAADGWGASRSLGHLLFCYAGAHAGYRERGDIRLAVFASCDPPPLWQSAVAHLDLEVTFVNVSEVIGPRLEENPVAA